MAIPVLNSQGTKLFVVTVPTTPWADCTTASTAILAGSAIGCPQSIGAIEESRSVTEYKCLSSNDTAKALGSISRGNIQIGLLFDPEDATGQAALKAAFQGNYNIVLGIEFPDVDLTAGALGSPHGTIFWFEGGISTVSVGIEQDAAVTYTVTVEISSEVTECAMKPGTAV